MAVCETYLCPMFAYVKGVDNEGLMLVTPLLRQIVCVVNYTNPLHLDAHRIIVGIGLKET